MPRYSFKCDKCSVEKDVFTSVSNFIKMKAEAAECSECESGLMIHRIKVIRSNIEKSKEQIVMETKEEVRKTVDKIRNGDRRTIEDIYGDRPNKYKYGNS